MNEGWWVNYKTHRYVELLCRHVDHERAIRDPQNQEWLGVSPSVVRGFRRFMPQTDRDALLRYAMQRCPIMRVRGHGGTHTTIEFWSRDARHVVEAISTWAERFACPTTMLHVSNLVTGRTMCLTVAEWNRLSKERSWKEVRA